MIAYLVGIATLVFLALLVFGLVTRRIEWRQQGCCSVGDPESDARVRTADPL